MEKWRIEYMQEAFNDIEAIADYIAYTLGDIYGAEKVVGAIDEASQKLESMPSRCPVYPDFPRYRYIMAGNYVVMFRIKEEEHVVSVLRVHHQHQLPPFLTAT